MVGPGLRVCRQGSGPRWNQQIQGYRWEGCEGHGQAPPLASAPLGAWISIPNPRVLPEQDFQVEKKHVSEDVLLSLQRLIRRRWR